MPETPAREHRRIHIEAKDAQADDAKQDGGTYPVLAWCHNCIFRGSVNTPRGICTPYDDYLLEEVRHCPLCGCATLQRVTREEELVYFATALEANATERAATTEAKTNTNAVLTAEDVREAMSILRERELQAGTFSPVNGGVIGTPFGGATNSGQ